jgi:hypothetical protein
VISSGSTLIPTVQGFDPGGEGRIAFAVGPPCAAGPEARLDLLLQDVACGGAEGPVCVPVPVTPSASRGASLSPVRFLLDAPPLPLEDAPRQWPTGCRSTTPRGARPSHLYAEPGGGNPLFGSPPGPNPQSSPTFLDALGARCTVSRMHWRARRVNSGRTIVSSAAHHGCDAQRHACNVLVWHDVRLPAGAGAGGNADPSASNDGAQRRYRDTLGLRVRN